MATTAASIDTNIKVLSSQYADALVAYHIENRFMLENPSKDRSAYNRLLDAQEALNTAALAGALAASRLKQP